MHAVPGGEGRGGCVLFLAGFRGSWVKGLVASTGPVPWYSQSMGLSKVRRCIVAAREDRGSELATGGEVVEGRGRGISLSLERLRWLL